jgi:hypothetical protein
VFFNPYSPGEIWVTSFGGGLMVGTLAVGPAFTIQPASQTVAAGTSVTFVASASGSPAPGYRWKKNGADIAGATSASFTIASAQLADAGSYTVVATNSSGSITSNVAILTVNSPPIITAQPVAQYATAGAMVTFTVGAIGNPTPAYQWNKNGVAISGATTASLAIGNVQLSDSATYTVTITNTLGAVTSNPAALTVTTPSAHPVASDYNNDGKVDILWRNSANGDYAVWFMNGTSFQSGQVFGHVDAPWRLVGGGDFTQDGQTDLLWRNTVNGDLALWVMNGTVRQQGFVFNAVALSWEIAATGDFNADGKTDILWRNTVTGDVALWAMNGTNFVQGFIFNSVPLVWRLCGAGDFNQDGKTDILWRNTVTGDVALWVMNGTVFQQGFIFETVALSWDICGAGDFNGDGKTDILWRNNVTGDVALWIMDGTTVQQGFIFNTIPLAWQVVQ